MLFAGELHVLAKDAALYVTRGPAAGIRQQAAGSRQSFRFAAAIDWAGQAMDWKNKLLRKRLLFIANTLKQHPVGLQEVADGIWSIHFCRVLLGRVDERDYIIRA